MIWKTDDTVGYENLSVGASYRFQTAHKARVLK